MQYWCRGIYGNSTVLIPHISRDIQPIMGEGNYHVTNGGGEIKFSSSWGRGSWKSLIYFPPAFRIKTFFDPLHHQPPWIIGKYTTCIGYGIHIVLTHSHENHIVVQEGHLQANIATYTAKQEKLITKSFWTQKGCTECTLCLHKLSLTFNEFPW